MILGQQYKPIDMEDEFPGFEEIHRLIRTYFKNLYSGQGAKAKRNGLFP